VYESGNEACVHATGTGTGNAPFEVTVEVSVLTLTTNQLNAQNLLL